MDTEQETISNFYDESSKIKEENLFTEEPTFVNVEIENNVLSQLTSQNKVKIEYKDEANLESISSGYNDSEFRSSECFVNTSELENHLHSQIKFECKDEADVEQVLSIKDNKEVKASDCFVNTSELENHPYSQVKFECKDEVDIEPVLVIKDIREVEASDYFVNTSDLNNYEEELENNGDTVVNTECSSYGLSYLKQPFHKNTIKTRKKNYENSRKCPCPLCRKNFPTLASRKKHFNSHFRNTYVLCVSCGTCFISKREFLVHYHINHAVKKKKRLDYTSKLLNPFNHDIKNAKLHNKGRRNNKLKKCEICFKVLAKKSNIALHLRTHTGERPFKCTICLKTFIRNFDLVRHSLIHKNAKPFECKLCFKQFTDKHNLEIHMRIHNDIRPYECNVCSKKFTAKKFLDSHVKIHLEKSFKCDLCPKKYTRKASLILHKQNHNNEKVHKCPLCPRFLNSIGSLNGHVKTHAHPHECDKCFKRFRVKISLSEHYRKHTGEKPFKCDICFKDFTVKRSLITHMKVHNKPEPVKCETCSTSFREMKSLKRHMKRMHSGEKRFKCKICSQDFVEFYGDNGLRYHLSNVHKNPKRKKSTKKSDESIKTHTYKTRAATAKK